MITFNKHLYDALFRPTGFSPFKSELEFNTFSELDFKRDLYTRGIENYNPEKSLIIQSKFHNNSEWFNQCNEELKKIDLEYLHRECKVSLFYIFLFILVAFILSIHL